MGLGHSPSIVVDGLVFYIDPNNPNCYPGFGNTLYNIVNTSIGGTFVGYTSNPIDNTETRSIYFDGTNDYMVVGSLGITYGDSKSLFAWIKPSTVSSTTAYTRLLNYMPDASNRFILALTAWNTPTNTYKLSGTPNNNISSFLKTSQNYNLNEWKYVGWTFNGSAQNFYVDGVLQSSIADTAGSFSFTGVSGLIIGARTDTSATFYKGNIGQASIYNRTLTATEILQNYNATKKKYMPEENIVTNGLVLNIDPANRNSYSGTGNTIYDLSGSGNTGILTNGPTYSSLNSGSIVFDGSNDYIEISNIDFNSNSVYTASFWFKTINNSSQQYILDFRESDVNNRTAIVAFNQSGTSKKIHYAVQGSGDIWPSASTILGLNKWYHIGVTHNSSTNNLKIYLDGILNLDTEFTQDLISTSLPLRIGARNLTAAFPLYGNISQLKIYNRALTAQEISQNYNATKKRFVNALPPVRNGLVMELDAGQRSSYPGTGNTWYDLSGNSLNGTLTNGPTFSGIGATSSIVFDKTNDYVTIADNSLLNSFTGMTLEILVKYSTTNNQIFAQKWNYVSGSQGITLEIYTSAIVGACYNSGSGYLSVPTSSYPINNIYHIIFTLSGSTQTMYINGVSVATNSSGSVPSTSGCDLRIGGRSGGNSPDSYLGGNVYLTKFYNRGLSAYEVKQNFDFYRTRYNI
jgi:hypothetical protein